MQLNKYLALCGVASRRKANLPIVEGKITVNGKIIRELGVVVDPDQDAVCYNGQTLKQPEKYRYIVLNKPGNVLTTAEDARGRRTVMDVVNVAERIFPVGRLDFDTTGVLILTNDGDLAYRLAHPKYVIDKVYKARVRGEITETAIDELQQGVWLKGIGEMRGEARILKAGKKESVVEVRLHEGKKRQVKRMLKAVGHPVQKLERINFAGLTVGPLPKGGWRDLTRREVDDLYAQTGLKKQT